MWDWTAGLVNWVMPSKGTITALMSEWATSAEATSLWSAVAQFWIGTSISWSTVHWLGQTLLTSALIAAAAAGPWMIESLLTTSAWSGLPFRLTIASSTSAVMPSAVCTAVSPSRPA